MRGLFAGIGRDLPRVYILNGGTRAGYDLAPRCLVSVNGRQCRLEDLAEGDEVSVEGRPAVAVRASRPSDKPLPPAPPPPPRGWADDGRGYPTPVLSAPPDANVDNKEEDRRFLPPPVSHAGGASTPVNPCWLRVVEVGPGNRVTGDVTDLRRDAADLTRTPLTPGGGRTLQARREPRLVPKGS